MESFSEWNAGIVPVSEHVPTLIKVWLLENGYRRFARVQKGCLYLLM